MKIINDIKRKDKLSLDAFLMKANFDERIVRWSPIIQDIEPRPANRRFTLCLPYIG